MNDRLNRILLIIGLSVICVVIAIDLATDFYDDWEFFQRAGEVLKPSPPQ